MLVVRNKQWRDNKALVSLCYWNGLYCFDIRWWWYIPIPYYSTIIILFFCVNEMLISLSLKHKIKGQKKEIGVNEYIKRTQVTSINNPWPKQLLWSDFEVKWFLLWSVFLINNKIFLMTTSLFKHTFSLLPNSPPNLHVTCSIDCPAVENQTLSWGGGQWFYMTHSQWHWNTVNPWNSKSTRFKSACASGRQMSRQ